MSTVPLDCREYLAAELRRRREAKRLSPEELAAKAGLHAQTVRKIESHERWLSDATLEALASALGCRPRDLMP